MDRALRSAPLPRRGRLTPKEGGELLNKRIPALAFAVLGCFLITRSAGLAQTLTVMQPTTSAVSPPLSQIPNGNNTHGNTAHAHRPVPSHVGAGGSHADTALQTSAGPLINATGGTNFDGAGVNGFAPPDANIAVGPNHIFEAVNSSYTIYDHSGNMLLGPKTLSSLWIPLGGPCGTNNGGDTIVQYDRFADRWVLTQLGSVSGPYSECIAVSRTNDPTGAYNLYSYYYGSTLNDYPKFGVWPTATNSAYLATYNLFANGASFSGGQLCAYDRSGMIAGTASPAAICYTISFDGGYLPADVDGSNAPLDGTPGYFLNLETLSSLRMYKLSPDFANPAASTLTFAQDLTVTGFNEACGGGTCVPQSGTNQQLDSLGDRLMYRLAFRRFADHEAMVVNHSVAAGSAVGVRWYELRAPVSASAVFSVFQQGTFAPADSAYRWMGSAAMNQSGDIAIGYSVSSSAVHPGIRYTGRVPGDLAGTMETETSIIEGSGSQTNGLSRWGDYSALRIDPGDDCTFWYVNEYLKADGAFNWSTRIGSFKFSSCAPSAPDFTLSANPASTTVNPGQQDPSSVADGSVGGFNSAVALTVSGCPPTATCSLSSNSVTPPANGSGTSTLTVTDSIAENFTVTVSGNGGTHSTTVTVTAPDFSLSANPASITVNPGQQGTSTVTVTSINGFNSAVGLTVSGCPAFTTCSMSPSSVTPPANGSAASTLTVVTNVNGTTPAGTVTLTISGNSGVHTTTVSLKVNSPAADFTISVPSSLGVSRGSSGFLDVTLGTTNGATSVTLSISGLPSRTSSSFSVNSVAAPGTSRLTISASRPASRGTYTVTVTGTNGSFTHSATLTLTIN